MADRKDELLTHVLDNPDDDEARLVYADYLSGQGDARGEFINAQVGLAGRITPARRKKLKAIERSLLRKHGDEFSQAAKAAGLRPTLRRGFIDEITGTAKKFVAGGAALVATEPVQRVSLKGGGNKHLEEMVAGGLLAKVRTLKLHDGKLGDKGIAALAGSEQLASLRILNIANNQVTDEGLRSLVQSPHFQLRSLTLNANQITNAGLRSIAAAPQSHTIECLYVARNGIDGQGPAMLLQSPHLDNLVNLSLSGNEDIGDAGVLTFADEGLTTRFKVLELEQISISRPTRRQMREIWGSRIKIDGY